jgi:uncharacterized protein YjiS (DUF1127 family)
MERVLLNHNDLFGGMCDTSFDGLDQGSRMLGNMEVSAWEAGYREIRLTINVLNKKALAFYFGHNYQILGQFKKDQSSLLLGKRLYREGNLFKRIWLSCHVWRARPKTLHLENMSDHLLHDVGIQDAQQYAPVEKSHWHRWL